LIYLDSSALLKSLLREHESAALLGWLSERPDLPRAASELSRTEVIRACRRFDESVIPAARQLLGSLDLIPMTADLLERAAMISPVLLRSLDAIHLASALTIGPDLSAFVAYDRRLQAAAEDARMPVVAPA
jgi:predicted nucleic acid-binding protein